MQSLRKGVDRQCKTNPIHAVTAGLVRIALPLYTAVGMKKGELCRTRELPVSGGWLRVGSRDCRFQRRGWSARLMVVQCEQTAVWATLRIMCREEVGRSLQRQVRFVLSVRLQHVNNLDCSTGAFSARRRGLGIFALAALTWMPDKHVHAPFDPICGLPEGRSASNSIRNSLLIVQRRAAS